MANSDDLSEAAEMVRKLAEQGLLTQHHAQCSAEERRWLWAGACQTVWPLVYSRVTRRVERERGHHRCAVALHLMEPECFDRFSDDVEASVDDLLAHADLPIHNLEGWVTMRLPRALIEGYRRRRGARGAAQRPRIPAWLATQLDAEPWRVELARLILVWVGVPTTATTGLWPLDAWSGKRHAMTGDSAAGPATVAAEVDEVLTAMRRRPNWYEKYVERPLGRKQTPVWLPPVGDGDKPAEPDSLLLVPQHERDDAMLTALAAETIEVLTLRVERGDDPRSAVVEVLTTVFGALPDELDQVPGAGPSAPNQVVALINDEETLDRIVATVLELVGPAGR